MDFLPKRKLDRHAKSGAPSRHTPGLRNFGPDRNAEVGNTNRATPQYSALSMFGTAGAPSVARTWIIFSPTLALIVALIATYRLEGFDSKTCAYAIGFALMFHNLGSVVQRMMTKAAPAMSGAFQIARVALPLFVLGALLLWTLSKGRSGFFEQIVSLGVQAAVLVLVTHMAIAWFERRAGRPWFNAGKVVCCIYLAVLFSGAFVVRVPSVAFSLTTLFALIGIVAFVLHLLTDEGTVMPLQVASLTYTSALWDTQADPERMTAFLSVALTLLFLLVLCMVVFCGVWRIGKK